MHSFIMKITHSVPAKDAIAVGRGIYKVIEGGIYSSRADNLQVNIQKSWHDISFNTKQQPAKAKQSKQKQEIQILNQQKQTVGTASTYKFQNQSLKINDSQQKSKIKKQSVKSEQKIETNKQSNQNLHKSARTEQNYRQFIKNIESQDVNLKQNKKQVIQSKVPSSRVSRIFQFTKLGLNIAESAVQAYFAKIESDPAKQNPTYQKIANKISDQLCKMRGAPLKLAQMLSIQQDKLIPTPIRRAFEKARQTAHILPLEEVTFMMEKNFGNQWRTLFKVFQQKPFASASIGQVHLAEIENIGEVAIKIQYPGVRKSIQSDISNLQLLMKIPGVFPKGMYMDRILKNTKLELTQQCDYILEKQKQQAYQKCLKLCLKQDFSLYKVPTIYSAFTTEQIFTSQYLSGVTMKSLEQSQCHQQIKDQIGRRIMEITFNELFQMGIVQSDPNPSNFTYNFKKDQLNLFDFGATHVYKKKFLQDYHKIIQGSVMQNKEQILKASINTGFLTGQQSEAMKQNHIQSILITGQPLRFKGKYDFGNQKITQKIYKTIPVMLKNRLKHPPQQVYSLHRKLSGSYLACMRLKARVDCSKIWSQIKFQRIIENIDKNEKSKLVI